MKLKKYLTLTRAGVIESLQFRLSTLIMIVGNLLYLIIVYFLWKAIYASAGTDTVSGMTFTETLIYLVLATALFGFMEMYTVWEIGRNIQSGKIVLDLLKPMKYRSYLFWSYSGSFVTNFFFTFFPTFLIVMFVTHGAIHIGINLLLFAVSVTMAVLINYSVDFIVGTICLYTESIWGINIMKQVVVLLLSGATIPLAFFPEPLKTMVYHLPFQSIYNAPLSILLYTSSDDKSVLTILGTQLMWCIIMSCLSKLFWKVSLRQITVNGGWIIGEQFRFRLHIASGNAPQNGTAHIAGTNKTNGIHESFPLSILPFFRKYDIFHGYIILQNSKKCKSSAYISRAIPHADCVQCFLRKEKVDALSHAHPSFIKRLHADQNAISSAIWCSFPSYGFSIARAS